MVRDQAIKLPEADGIVVVDVQQGFVAGSNAVPDHKRLISMVDVLLTRARSANVPVIFLQNDGGPGETDEPHQPGWELYFHPHVSDYVVRKKSDNGFQGTNLGHLLESTNVHILVICGVLSEMCVAATARAAMENGYRIILPHNAHATYDIPAGPGSEGVPAAMASRVVEWSLGDEVVIYKSACDVQFAKRQSIAG